MGSQGGSKDVALAYIDAVGKKRWDELDNVLHREFEFMLGGRVLKRDDAIAALRRLAPILVRNDVTTTLVDGREVLVIYDFVTDTLVGPVQSAEWINVEDGLVRSTRLIFDHEHWPSVLEELERRASGAA